MADERRKWRVVEGGGPKDVDAPMPPFAAAVDEVTDALFTSAALHQMNEVQVLAGVACGAIVAGRTSIEEFVGELHAILIAMAAKNMGVKPEGG